MDYPISWLKDFVDITLPIPELAHLLTLAGMEVEKILYVGWPLPEDGRGEAAMTRTRWLWLPDEDGGVTVADLADIPAADRPAADIPAADIPAAETIRRLRVVNAG